MKKINVTKLIEIRTKAKSAEKYLGVYSELALKNSSWEVNRKNELQKLADCRKQFEAEAEALTQAIAEAEGNRTSARKIDAQDIIDDLIEINDYLGITKKSMKGTTARVDHKQADLAQQNVVTTIIRYSGYATGGDLGDWVPNNQHASRMKKPFPMLRMIVSFKGHGSDDSAWHDHGGMHVGLYVDYATGSADPSGDWTSIKYTTTSVTPGSKGVLAWVKSGRIYKNGDLVGSGIGSDTGWPGATPKIEESNQPLTFFVAGGTINYLAAAFYDCALTESQIQDVTLAINNF